MYIIILEWFMHCGISNSIFGLAATNALPWCLQLHFIEILLFCQMLFLLIVDTCYSKQTTTDKENHSAIRLLSPVAGAVLSITAFSLIVKAAVAYIKEVSWFSEQYGYICKPFHTSKVGNVFIVNCNFCYG